MNETYDVIIVGGSTAGLSAALTLARSLRQVLVIDGGQPCNRQTPHSHGFFTRDGESPHQLLSIARRQLLAYPTVTFLNGLVTSASRLADDFMVQTEQGQLFSARKLLLSTGIKDIMPPLPGFAECWGRSVLHCPYCHGYEVYQKRIGLLGNGMVGYELAGLIQHWNPKLTLYTNGPSQLTDEQHDQIGRLQIPIVEVALRQIHHTDGFMHRIELADGQTIALDALFARVPFQQTTDLARQLGADHLDNGLIQANDFGQTNVAGLYVAGDNSSPMRQIAMAAASGAKAAAVLNREMIEENWPSPD